jgi:threonine dehydratase
MVTAMALCEEQGLTYINGYNDAAIIAGQGTAALEILEQVSSKDVDFRPEHGMSSSLSCSCGRTQVPEVDAIVVPVGGAGLIAGTPRTEDAQDSLVLSFLNTTPSLPQASRSLSRPCALMSRLSQSSLRHAQASLRLWRRASP